MFSKHIWIGIFGTILNTIILAQTQQIGISAFGDISSEPDEVISTIVQNSLANVLKREKRFSITLVSNITTNLSTARKEAIKNKLDVILYGTYRKESKQFLILVQIYDILENEMRLSRLYQGEYSRSIFDTVDTIADSASEEINRALPPLLTEENITRVQIKRKELYEQKEISLKREMRLSLGVCNFSYTYSLYKVDTSTGIPFSYSWQGSGNVVTPTIFLSMRLEWLRFSFTTTGLPWVPSAYSFEGKSSFTNEEKEKIPPSLSGIALSYMPSQTLEIRGDIFLGSPEKLQGFVSLFLMGEGFRLTPQQNLSYPLIIGIGGGISRKNWEVSLLFQVFPFSQGWKDIILGFSPDSVFYSSNKNFFVTVWQQNFPHVKLSASYFFSPFFGINVKGSYSDAQELYYRYEDESRAWLHNFSKTVASRFIFSLEAIYRFQFGL